MTRSTQRRIDPEQADRRFDGSISGLMNGATISGFTTIGGEWVWRFLGSRRSVTNGFDNFWVRDLRNGFDVAISLSLSLSLSLFLSLSLSLFAHLSPSFSRSLSLSLWALLDERARSWVFWVRQSSWMWIDLAFTGDGVLVRSLFLVVSLSLLFSWGGSDLKWKWKRKLFSFPLSLILRSNWKHFQLDRIFNNSQTSTFPKKHFRNQFKAKQTEP